MSTDTDGSQATPAVRTGQGIKRLSRSEFERRYRERFSDPAFSEHAPAIQELLEVAWDAYEQGRKSPTTRKAGAEFADPDYELSVDWLKTREAIRQAQRDHEDPAGAHRILLICASARNDKSCPGEMSKSFRMVQLAKEQLQAQTADVEVLDLSALTSEFGKVIFPCKACVSTAMPLCHWPCSCYPNHSLGQVTDWMADIYPKWVAAHGIMIITPVYWYQAPTVLKAMIDRLVCADGGNPDPTTTHGKHAAEAKAMELAGWDYPRHLEGRSYALVVHGDAAGTEALRRALTDWLNDMRLIEAGAESCFDRYVDYYGKYANSHEAYDRESALHQEVRNAARALLEHVARIRQNPALAARTAADPRPK